MQLNITARHINLTPALSDYVHKKIEKAQRYFDAIVWAQTVLAVEKHRHIAEVVVHTPGNTLRTKGEAGDLYSAIDMAAHKLDLALARMKDRRRTLRKDRGREAAEVAPSSNPFALTAAQTPGLESAIREVNKVLLEPCSLTRAIRKLHSHPLPFLLFINERTNQISAVYKKGKEGYGLIEAEVA